MCYVTCFSFWEDTFTIVKKKIILRRVTAVSTAAVTIRKQVTIILEYSLKVYFLA